MHWLSRTRTCQPCQLVIKAMLSCSLRLLFLPSLLVLPPLYRPRQPCQAPPAALAGFLSMNFQPSVSFRLSGFILRLLCPVLLSFNGLLLLPLLCKEGLFLPIFVGAGTDTHRIYISLGFSVKPRSGLKSFSLKHKIALKSVSIVRSKSADAIAGFDSRYGFPFLVKIFR
jgi:hypothetical protein